MATYVLVHGAWGGGWMNTPTARKLREAGHEVFVAHLTGLGQRSHLANGGIDLDLHVKDVTNIFEYEDLSDVILVGHSYGGMVITGTAAQVGDRIRTLVYVDAFLPKDGEALWDIADPNARGFYVDGQRETPGLIRPLFQTEGPLPPKVHLHPLLTLIQPVRFTGKEQQVKNRTYIYATQGAPTAFTGFYERCKGDAAWRVHEIDTSHNVMADDLDGYVKLLLEEAER